MMITFAKETSGIDCDKCTLVDEFVARVLKNCRGDGMQATEVDFRTVVDARMVFHIYSRIKSQGGTMKAYPSKQLPSVTEVISEFIAAFQKMPDWRGLDDEEMRLLGTLKQIWIDWYDDATETEGSDLSALSRE